MMRTHTRRSTTRGGQAILEFIIGLVAVLALLAGLLQLASLTKNHTDAMVEARRLAGEQAIMNQDPGAIMMSDADYIRDWQVGPDKKQHTPDDVATKADPAAFNSIMIEKAVSAPGEWDTLDQVASNKISLLHNYPNPAAYFGLLKGSDKRTVNLIPAAQHLYYDAKTIDIQCNVWMTWTKGIY